MKRGYKRKIDIDTGKGRLKTDYPVDVSGIIKVTHICI